MSLYTIKGKTPPVKTKTFYPISLPIAKRHLRVDEDWYDDDDYIQNLIYAATEKAEQYIGKDIALTTNVMEYYDFVGDDITIDEGNFIQVDSIVTDSSTLVTVNQTRKYYNSVFIDLIGSVDSDPLTITYQTGYNEDKCPSVIKQAILIKLADLYDIDRSNYTLGTFKEGQAFERLLDSYKLIQF